MNEHPSLKDASGSGYVGFLLYIYILYSYMNTCNYVVHSTFLIIVL